MADKSTPKAAAAPKPTLARAAESGEPDVHRLLGLRQAAVSGDDKAALKRIDEELAALGVKA